MSVTIRLAKFGKKHAPAYKIVVANTKDKRNGKFLDILGHYNPSENPVKFEYDKEKYTKWVGHGALISNAVEQLVAGTYVQKPHDPHKELFNKENTPKEEEKEVKTEEKKEDVVEEQPVEEKTPEAEEVKEEK